MCNYKLINGKVYGKESFCNKKTLYLRVFIQNCDTYIKLGNESYIQIYLKM